LFNDQDGDGIADDVNADGQAELVATGRSDANGNVSFTGLADGGYVISLVDSAGLLDGLSPTTVAAQNLLSGSTFVNNTANNTQASFGFNTSNYYHHRLWW